MRTFIRIAKFAAIVCQCAILSGWFWLYLESRSAAPAKSEPAMFEIEKGKGVRAIAASLKAEKIIRKAWPFVFSYKLFYAPRTIKAGEYQLPRSGPIKDVLETLVRGSVYLHPVTIAEGLTGSEIAADFLASGFGVEKDFAAAFRATDEIALWDPKAENLEGYLFPDTYRLPKGITAREIFQKMTAEFKVIYGERGRRRTAELQRSVRDIVILASLIEKETARPDEKKLVASVFHNRLALGMKLDCDPTIIYALKLKKTFGARLRTKDLKLDSPYNTYLYPGLPPGPICNPGALSLEAALYPAQTEYIYFVSQNDGSHYFSRTLAEHQRAVKKYQR